MKNIFQFKDGQIKRVTVDNRYVDLIYSICFYADRGNCSNLNRQIQQAYKIKEKYKINLAFIVICAFDDMSELHIDKKLKEFSNQIDSDLDFYYMPIFNWGGTIAALWHLWKDIIKVNILNAKHVVHMEEDIEIFNFNWYSMALNSLKDFIYVGETTLECGAFKQTSSRGQSGGNKTRVKLSDIETWSDGGFYFTSPDRLKIMEEKIGIFHKGDNTSKWDHHVDGIDLGEVGFPTLLFNSGLKFTTISRHKFFNHN